MIKDLPGDSYFVRSMFDYVQQNSGYQQLRFKKDDILFIDNTMYDGVPGNWSAWLVDQDGEKMEWGIVPSKYKVEEEMLLKRTGDPDLDSGSGHSRRTWHTARSSFFKRKRKSGSGSGHIPGFARSSSRESKELASFSDVASLSYADPDALQDEMQINSYIRVERMDCKLQNLIKMQKSLVFFLLYN